MTQVFIVCVCSVIKNSQETGLFIVLFAFVLFFHICSVFLFMVLMSLNQLVPNGRTQKIKFILNYSLNIAFNCSATLNRPPPTSQSCIYSSKTFCPTQ